MPRFCLFGLFRISLSVRLLSRLPLSLSISTWVTPVHTSCCYCCLVAQSCLTLCPSGLLCPWDFPGKNTGVGSHFLLQSTHLISPIMKKKKKKTFQFNSKVITTIADLTSTNHFYYSSNEACSSSIYVEDCLLYQLLFLLKVRSLGRFHYFSLLQSYACENYNSCCNLMK